MFKPWLDLNGEVTTNADLTPDDNPITHSVAYFNLIKNPEPPEWDWLLGVFRRHALYGGLINYARRIGDIEPSAQDDHEAVASKSNMRASAMLKWGRSTAWIWGNGSRAELFFGRFVTFPPMIELCANGDTSVLGKLLIAGAFIQNAFNGKKHDNSRLRLSVIHDGVRGLSTIVDTALWIWRKRAGGRKVIYANYFSQPGNPMGNPDNVTEWS